MFCSLGHLDILPELYTKSSSTSFLLDNPPSLSHAPRFAIPGPVASLSAEARGSPWRSSTSQALWPQPTAVVAEAVAATGGPSWILGRKKIATGETGAPVYQLHLSWGFTYIILFNSHKNKPRTSLVIQWLSANSGDMGSIPSLGRSHMPQDN